MNNRLAYAIIGKNRLISQLEPKDASMPPHLQLHHREDDERTLNALEHLSHERDFVTDLVPRGYEHYFKDQASIVSAYSSISIEGNPLDYPQVQAALMERERAADPSRREARNAYDAYEFANHLAEDDVLAIDQGLLRTFNWLLLDGLPGGPAANRGRYRRGRMFIGDPTTGETRYTAPPAAWVPDLMDGFEDDIADWVEDDRPEIAAAKIHFGLVTIHPYSDGNGRTSRLAADLVLRLGGRSIGGMLSVSGVLLDRRTEYFDALNREQGTEFRGEIDVTRFVRFHTEVLAEAVSRLGQRADAFQARRNALERRYGALMSERRIIGLLYAFEFGGLATSAWAKFARCAQATALGDLGDLAEAGLVHRVGRARNTRYVLDEETRALIAEAA